MQERGSATFLEVGLSFILGAIFGAAFALLYAPAPGTETRRVIREKAETFRDQAELAVAQVRSKVRRPQRVIEVEEEATEPSSTGSESSTPS